MRTAAIDVGGTRLKIALVEDGNVLEKHVVDVPDNSHYGEALELALPTVKAFGPIDGLGISFAGLVDPRRRVAIESNGKSADAASFDLVGWGMHHFGCVPVLENDANAALIGEMAYGAGRGCRDAVMMILGTGVGTAAYMDGRPVRGAHFQAGCLGGHLTVQTDGPMCSCGNRGCVEALAGTWALPRAARADARFAQSALSRAETVDFRAIADACRAGDALATDLLHRCVRAWGAGIVNLIHAYDPERVLLSGGVLHCADLFLEELQRYVDEHAWTPWGKVRFAVAQDPETSVLLGLHHLCAEGLSAK